ncbi:MAG: energy transducer TonB [Gammaproteobacteria bacterium]|nr:energy transducer TonB [Gammaproteobacteria bacterium]
MFRLLFAAILLSGSVWASSVLADDDKIVAVDRPEPEYPKKAFQKCVEGHVIVKFIITTEGTTKDIEVVSSRPERVFEKAAVAAVEKWIFEPRVINGVAVNREAIQRLIFEPGCIR